jgi:hypothetical protein
MNNSDFYKLKYLKYKNKYISLKKKNNQEGGKLKPKPGKYLFYIRRGIIEKNNYSIHKKKGSYFVRNSLGAPTNITYDNLCSMSALVIPLDQNENVKPTDQWFITEKDNYIFILKEQSITLPTTQDSSPASAKNLFESAYTHIPDDKKPTNLFDNSYNTLCLKYTINEISLNRLIYVTEI